MRKKRTAKECAINTRVPTEVRSSLDELCDDEDLGMSEAVREALDIYLAFYDAAGGRRLNAVERDALVSHVAKMATRVHKAVKSSRSD